MSLERVELEMEIRKEEDPTTLQKVDVVYKKIFLFGNLSAADREKLLEIAGKCPVNKTLQNGIKSVAVLG
jgi:putative redox protein